jgi:ferritin-like metal-binding protein YciE
MAAAAPKDLRELYTAGLRDLWSANDQMQRVVQAFAQRAADEKVRQLFEHSVPRIAQHTQALRELAVGSGTGEASPCPGMQGLVQEATDHALESDLPPLLRDLEMLAQYQRMSHYGIAGFGTVAAYADALGLQDQAQRLREIVADIYRGDDYASQLAVSAQRAAAGAGGG